MFTKCYLNSEYIHSRLINLGQKGTEAKLYSRPSTLAVTGANVTNPFGVYLADLPKLLGFAHEKSCSAIDLLAAKK